MVSLRGLAVEWVHWFQSGHRLQTHSSAGNRKSPRGNMYKGCSWKTTGYSGDSQEIQNVSKIQFFSKN